MKTNTSMTIINRDENGTNNTGMRICPLEIFPVQDSDIFKAKRRRHIGKKELSLIYLMHHSKKARVRKKNYKRFKEEYLIPLNNDIYGNTKIGKGRKAVVLKRN